MKTYWIENSKRDKGYKTLKEDMDTDVCIIGGGLTGISTAYYLNKYQIKNVILEKGRLVEKTSGHSTAKITSQHGLFYKYLIDSQGKNFAQKYYEANEKAIKEIAKIIQKESIQCDFEVQSSYVFTQGIKEVEKIKDEVEAVNQIGGKANYITSIPHLKAIAAIEFPNQAQFNPYKYATSLAEICEKQGTKIFENSLVKGMHELNRGYEVVLENGKKVKAKYVVLATRYPIIDIPGYHFIKMYQSTSNVIVIDPKEEAFSGMYINSEDPTISLRTIKDGDKRLVMVAGFDHKTGAKIDLSNGYKYLEKEARNIYPNCEVKYKWNTQDCISLDKIPYIGEFSNHMPNVYVGTGYKKWGVTTSNIAANIIVDKILGNDNEYEDLYKATRLKPIKNIKELGNMVKESINSLIIEKMKVPDETINQVKENEGKIIDMDGEKVGVYKNEKGEIFKVRPVCQHLGCELSWNNLDKTWDCPCHGSRYDYRGHLIYGPSVKDLDVYNND